MATPKSGRQSRKRRRRGAGPQTRGASGVPAGVVADATVHPRAGRRGRAQPRQRPLAPSWWRTSTDTASSNTMMGAYGERPASPFGGLPISEVLIFVGAIGTVVGLVESAPVALAAGLVACVLGVGEFSIREHFSGYRSHTTLLAAIPAIAAGIAMIALVGGSLSRSLLLVVVVPVFVVCFLLLRKRFRLARHARIARPPGP